MAFYLLRAKLDHEFMKALVKRPEDRKQTALKLLEGIGGKLHHYFYCFGDYDIVLIYENPDNITAAALSMVLTASDSVKEVETTPLLTTEEATAAMGQACDAMGLYEQPVARAKKKNLDS